MINITIQENAMLDFMMDRVKYKGISEDDAKLYEMMYSRKISNGDYENSLVDIYNIINNDTNFCMVLVPGDKDYNTISEVYYQQGLGSIDCEKYSIGYSYAAIEAYKDGNYLVRW